MLIFIKYKKGDTMSDPKKFKPYYIVEAYSPATKKIRQLVLATETERMKKLASLEQAKIRSREFANSLNENKTLGTTDWQPMIHFQHEKDKQLLVAID